MKEALSMADAECAALWDGLSLEYTESQVHIALACMCVCVCVPNNVLITHSCTFL